MRGRSGLAKWLFTIWALTLKDFRIPDGAAHW
jgi:hypothetical protein